MIKYLKENFDYPLIGAEVGVGLGNHALEIVQNLHLQKLYLIDHWQPYLEQEKGLIINNYAGKADQVRQKFSVFDFVEIIEQDSLSAVKLFKDKCFDFIYIDANPSYESTMQNINAWENKIKPGGILGGHNAKWAETWKAVWQSLDIENRIFIDGNDWWVVLQ